MSGVSVSVCIPVYNGSSYLEKQLNSILAQLDDHSEIIIIDDCSSDSSVEIIKGIKDPRIKLYQNAKNVGLYRNVEALLKKANGDLIFLSDQDDIWHPRRIEIATHHLGLCDLFICNALMIDQNGTKISDSYFDFRHTKHSVIFNFFKFGYLGCCMAFRNKFRPDEWYLPGTGKFVTHDIWIYFKYAIRGSVAVTNDTLHYYRRHETNDSRGGEKSQFSLCMKVKFRFYLAYYLVLDIWVERNKRNR